MSEQLVLGDVAPSVWEDFHAGRAAAIGPELIACWSRSRLLGAPPEGPAPEDGLVRGAELELHASQVELVRVLGDAVLDRAAARVSERDFVLLLADAEGVVVNTRGGRAFASTAQRVRLIEGACWSEAARGTNAIGTAVAANRPIEVHGHAHFGRRYHELVCYAAPVRGVDGTPLAVLDATSQVQAADPEVGRIVRDAARALEELLRLQAYASAGLSVTRVLGRSVERMREPALLIEAPGRIVRANATARTAWGRELIGGELATLLGRDWSALVAEALSPTPGGAPLELGPATARRAWRLRTEPIAAPGGIVLAMLVVLEPGRVVSPGAGRTGSPTAPTAPTTPPGPVDPFDAIFAEDPAVTAAIRWTRQLAASELPVMLLAETGAGKELFARAIHAASPRAAGPWHAVNCGALAPALLESELFGYAAGAFTGAERGGRAGLFHAASGGTLFLDEVAEMSPAMQAMLLRVLETGAFRRVGDVRLERTDVRVVCATCRDLGALVEAGAFRQDLYYRLKGATVRIPPLRERDQIGALARRLVEGPSVLSPEAEAAIARHRWPGNVRELKSALAVAQLAAAGAPWIELAHLPPELAPATAGPPGALDLAERDALQRALQAAGGNLSEAARTLGVARSTLYRMMRRHRIG
ncbi:MAG: sigma-54-dependent Fis family transcriptional regulator [Kofleriaceae bacterium]